MCEILTKRGKGYYKSYIVINTLEMVNKKGGGGVKSQEEGCKFGDGGKFGSGTDKGVAGRRPSA